MDSGRETSAARTARGPLHGRRARHRPAESHCRDSSRWRALSPTPWGVADCTAQPSDGKKPARVEIQEVSGTAGCGTDAKSWDRWRVQVTGIWQEAVGHTDHQSIVIMGMPDTSFPRRWWGHARLHPGKPRQNHLVIGPSACVGKGRTCKSPYWRHVVSMTGWN